LLFKILSISNGWFEIDFNRQFALTNSDYLGCDAPALLLEAIGNLLESKVTEQWLCWQDEPGAYILRLERYSDRLIVETYDTNKDSMSLEYSGISLSEHITKCLYRTEADIKKAAKSVLNEFELYENGNGRQRYKYHWGEFPQQNYNRLKGLMRIK